MGAAPQHRSSAMHAIRLVRVSALRPILGALARLGVPAGRHLERADLSPATLADDEALITLRQALRFLRETAVREGLADLGLIAGQQARIEDLGTYGRLVRRSRTLGEALAVMVRFSTAFDSGERWSVDVHDGEMRLRHWYLEPLEHGDEQADHYTVSLVINLIRLAAGATWTPREVQWQTGFLPAVVDSALFRDAHLAFGRPATTITLPRALLGERLLPGPARGRLPDDVDLWRSSAPARDLEGAMRQVIAAATPHAGHPRVEHAAAALGVSTRTLQRRLADGGLRFEHVLRTMRRDRAEDLLERTDSRILDIALALGYSDHAHFTRAFRSWTGLAPLEYRRRCRTVPMPGRGDRIPA